MTKSYPKYVRKCKVDLVWKDGTTTSVEMDLDLNDSVDDQICAQYQESKLKNWWWFEINGPTMRELRDMLLTPVQL